MPMSEVAPNYCCISDRLDDVHAGEILEENKMSKRQGMLRF